MTKRLLGRVLKACVILMGFTVLTFLTFWHICYGLTAGYALAAVWIGSVYLLCSLRWRATLKLFLVAGLGYLLTTYFSINEYNSRTAEMCVRIDAGNHLTTREKIGIYGLNILMGVAGYPIFPEASTETLLLCIPAENQRRVFQDDFFLKSNRIMHALNSGRSSVSWSLSDLASFGTEARTGLALNPCTILRKSGLLEVEVDVRYSRNFAVHVLGIIKVEEKLFWYLQQERWLFPYRAVWQAPIKDH